MNADTRPHPQVQELPEGDVPAAERSILEGYVVDAFRRGEMSSGQVAQLLGMRTRWEAIEFLSERGVYPGYEAKDLEDDIRVLVQLRRRGRWLGSR